MTLRERAHDALMAARTEEAEERARKTRLQEEQTRKQFEETFGVPPDTVQGNTATCDGLVLVNRTYFWQLKGRCPRCGEECESWDITNLADLGAQIEAFAPHWDHNCSEDEEVETAALRFVRTLSELLHEVGY